MNFNPDCKDCQRERRQANRFRVQEVRPGGEVRLQEDGVTLAHFRSRTDAERVMDMLNAQARKIQRRTR